MEVTNVLELLLELDGAIVVLRNSGMLVLFHVRNRQKMNLFALSLGMSKNVINWCENKLKASYVEIHLTTILLY